MESEGFVFEFGNADDEHVAATSSNADAISVPSGLSSFQQAGDVVKQWLDAYPRGQREQSLSLSDVAIVHYQAAARVAALEGDGNDPRDIVPGKYYGGLKVWSCAPDLAAYIHSHPELVCGLNVLEVGCGQAVPLISAVLSGASSATGHDYNREVIEVCTLPNLAASCAPRSSLDCSIRTGFGDWDAALLGETFDVILGSDVTYDPVACNKLANILVRILAQQGTALIATKQYYFGTNGGLAEFQDAVRRSSGGKLTTRQVARLGDGNEMQRIIIAVEWEH